MNAPPCTELVLCWPTVVTLILGISIGVSPKMPARVVRHGLWVAAVTETIPWQRLRGARQEESAPPAMDEAL